MQIILIDDDDSDQNQKRRYSLQVANILGIVADCLKARKYWTIPDIQSSKNTLQFQLKYRNPSKEIIIELNCNITSKYVDNKCQLKFSFSQSAMNGIPVSFLFGTIDNPVRLIQQINLFFSLNFKNLNLTLSLPNEKTIRYESIAYLEKETITKQKVQKCVYEYMHFVTMWVNDLIILNTRFNPLMSMLQKNSIDKNQASLQQIFNKQIQRLLQTSQKTREIKLDNLRSLNFFTFHATTFGKLQKLAKQIKNQLKITLKSIQSKKYQPISSQKQVGVLIKVTKRNDASKQLNQTFKTTLKTYDYQNADYLKLQQLQYHFDVNNTISIARQKFNDQRGLQPKWSEQILEKTMVCKTEKNKKRNSNQSLCTISGDSNPKGSSHSDPLQKECSDFINQFSIIDVISNLKCNYIDNYYKEQNRRELKTQYHSSDLLTVITRFMSKSDLPTFLDKLSIFQQLARAIFALGSKNVLHRDIKPTNIMVEECSGQTQIKVIDFGSAILSNIQIFQPQVIEKKYRRTLYKTKNYSLAYCQAKKISQSLEKSIEQEAKNAYIKKATQNYYITEQQAIKKYQRSELIKKTTEQKYNEHELFDMYSLGATMKIIFDLKAKRFNDDFFIQTIRKIIAKCMEIDPKNRLKPNQVICFLRKLRQLYQNANKLITP